MNDTPAQNKPPAERLAHLVRDNQARVSHSSAYTYFVKAMRLALPVVAIAIVAIVMAWPKMETAITPVTPESLAENQRPATQNELINPRFEGVDSKNNPYALTATRAVQSAQNPDILLLDMPIGDVSLGNDEKLAVTANKGNYRQKAGVLYLDGDVKLKHSNGYDMNTTRLMIDTQARETRTDQPVKISGPAGTIDATGFDARNNEGIIIFTGPAILILKESLKGL